VLIDVKRTRAAKNHSGRDALPARPGVYVHDARTDSLIRFSDDMVPQDPLSPRLLPRKHVGAADAGRQGACSPRNGGVEWSPMADEPAA